jgi:peptidoglycan/LPS O-acetylase OafA/YrhL
MGMIRLLLALTVVVVHLGHDFGMGGRNAVQLFYMISGFLISYVLTRNETYASPRIFWLNRALRLYPVYFAVLGLALAIRVREPGFVESFLNLPSAAKALLATVNITLLGQDWVEFIGVADGQLTLIHDFGESGLTLWNFLVIQPAWSLGVELSFYAIAPFIIRKPWLLWTLLALSVIARIFAVVAGFGAHDPWSYRFFPFELALFIAGALSHQRLGGLARRLIEAHPSLRLDCAVFVVLALLGIGYSWLPSGLLTNAALFAAMLTGLPFLLEFQKRVQFDNLIGELSYPLYICHVPVIYQLEIWTAGEGRHSLAFAVAAIVGSLLIAVCLKRAIIAPVERIRRRIAAGGGQGWAGLAQPSSIHLTVRASDTADRLQYRFAPEGVSDRTMRSDME